VAEGFPVELKLYLQPLVITSQHLAVAGWLSSLNPVLLLWLLLLLCSIAHSW